MKTIKTALILAAGKGNRISDLPLTKILPKPMLPLLNKPIIEHIINWLKVIGVKKIYIIVNFKKEVIIEYFGTGKDLGVKIEYIVQPSLGENGKRWGLGDVIMLASDKIREPFITVLGDDFTINKNFDIFPDTFFKNNALVVEAVVKDNKKESLSRACCLLVEKQGKILDAVEKPEYPRWNLRGCGIYLFDKKIFAFINDTPDNPARGGKDITETIRLIAQRTGKAYAVEVEKNININTLEDLNIATKLLLNNQ